MGGKVRTHIFPPIWHIGPASAWSYIKFILTEPLLRVQFGYYFKVVLTTPILTMSTQRYVYKKDTLLPGRIAAIEKQFEWDTFPQHN